MVEVTADLVDITSCRKIVSEATEKLQRLDVLVNNAGLMETGGIENVGAQIWLYFSQTVNTEGHLAKIHIYI